MNKPINQICLSTCVWATIIVIFFSVIVGGSSVLQNVRSQKKIEMKKLSIIGPLLIDSLSGFLLLNDVRSINAIVEEYKRKYRLREVIISHTSLSCPKTHLFTLKKENCWTESILDIKPTLFLKMTSNFDISFKTIYGFFIKTICPLILLGLLIPLLIVVKLKKTIVKPIIALANNPENYFLKNKHIAKEVATLSEKLVMFIQEREAQLLSAEKLKTDASIGKMAASIVHDLRSPLCVMGVTLSGILNLIPQREAEFLKEAVNIMDSKLRNLLTKYQHATGLIIKKSESEVPSSILLSELIDKLIQQKKIEWQANPCKIKKRIESSATNKQIIVNSDEIRSVLSNLMNNAYEALSSKKRSIIIKLFYENEYLNLKIEDTGHGIPPEKKEDVLNGTSLKHEGSGLGLATAKEYMMKIKGHLILNSIINKGTELTLLFPIFSPKAIT